MADSLGKLYLFPTPLGEDGLHALPAYALEALHRIEVFIAERGKTARQFLKQAQTPIPLQSMVFFELNDHTDRQAWPSYLQPALAGKDIGLMSEAGCPGVADPGAEIVRLAHSLGIEVVPLVGPSSILLALMASGMNGQSFAFHGYLPVQSADRRKALQNHERIARQFKQTQLFIETPYRNTGFIQDALNALQPHTLFGIAADLTLPTQYVRTRSVAAWRKNPPPDLNKRPAIFMLFAE